MSNLIEAVAICDAKGATFVDRIYDTVDGKKRLYAGFQRLTSLRDAVVYLQKSGVADHLHTNGTYLTVTLK